MEYLILALLGFMLYLDNISSAINGGFEDRGPFQMMFVVFLLILFSICFYIKNKHKILYVNKIVKFLFFLLSVILINDIVKSISLFSDLRFLYMGAWITIIVTFENFFLYMDKKRERHFLLGMYFLFIFSVYNAYVTLGWMMLDHDRMVIPCIYISIIFLPWILVADDKFYLKPVLVTILFLISVMSAKRGAIVAVFAAMLVFFYRKSKLETGRSSIVKVLGIGFVCAFLFFMIDSLFYGGYLAGRFSVDALANGSGRGDSNASVFYALANYATSGDILFGFSKETRNLMVDFLGHNDWLCFWVYYGLIGLSFFALFLFRVFKNSWSCKDKKLGPAYAALFVMMILPSLYSTTINPTIHPIFTMMFIGYAEGQIRKNKLTIETNE